MPVPVVDQISMVPNISVFFVLMVLNLRSLFSASSLSPSFLSMFKKQTSEERLQEPCRQVLLRIEQDQLVLVLSWVGFERSCLGLVHKESGHQWHSRTQLLTGSIQDFQYRLAYSGSSIFWMTVTQVMQRSRAGNGFAFGSRSCLAIILYCITVA